MDEKGLKFGFIGLGQGGCNIAESFSMLGYPAIAINTSSTDLDYLESIPKDLRLTVNDGTEGAGKNPEIGEAALENNINKIYDTILRTFNNVAKIFVCAGLGGGSGTGMIETMCKILIEESETFNAQDDCEIAAIITLPSNVESSRTKLIALSAYDKLCALEGLSNIFVIDNQKASERLPKLGLKGKYNYLNREMSKCIDNINKQVTIPSPVAFDAKDLFTTLDNQGLTIISEVTIDNINDLKKEEFYANLIDSAINSSIFANISKERIIIPAAAFLFKVPKKRSSIIKENAIELLKKNAGNPFDTGLGIYESDNAKENTGSFILILSGIDPDNNIRVKDLKATLDSLEQEINETLNAKKNSTSDNKAQNLLDTFTKKKRKNIASKNGDQQGPKKMSTLDRIRSV